jgi:hypothetical protein
MLYFADGYLTPPDKARPDIAGLTEVSRRSQHRIVSTPADRDSGPIVDDGSAHHWYICRVVIVESWKRLRAPLPVISQPYWENRSMARQF